MSDLLDKMKQNAEAAALEDANQQAQQDPNDPSSTVDEDNLAVDTILGTQVVNDKTGEAMVGKDIPTVDVKEVKEPEEAKDSEGDSLEVIYATRRGGGMTLNLEIPNEGNFLVDFKAGAVTLKGRAARAMREEYQRNEHMRRLITEVSASDRDTIMRLNREAAAETNRGHRGVGSARMGRPEDAAHTMQQNRTQQIAALTNKSSGALTPLNK